MRHERNGFQQRGPSQDTPISHKLDVVEDSDAKPGKISNCLNRSFRLSSYFTLFEDSKLPTKPAVYFTYTEGKRKKNTLSGQFQHHKVAKKAKRKVKRKAKLQQEKMRKEAERQELAAENAALKEKYETMKSDFEKMQEEMKEGGRKNELTLAMESSDAHEGDNNYREDYF
ncbi:hypothetical protein DL98DRAFT_589835 [Cadophora sp. DSE1049]|nr:hypothetical protein DL98DRAFT_589835 [Cadophora sp. DSE1049]